MLSSESLEIGERFRAAMRDRYGEGDARRPAIAAFDTICSATQERQDAVIQLLEQEPLDLMLVDRRLQQQQHVQPRAHLRRAAADISHRRARLPACPRDAIRFRPVGAQGGDRRGRLAALGRPRATGADGGRIDSRQPRGAGGRDRSTDSATAPAARNHSLGRLIELDRDANLLAVVAEATGAAPIGAWPPPSCRHPTAK